MLPVLGVINWCFKLSWKRELACLLIVRLSCRCSISFILVLTNVFVVFLTRRKVYWALKLSYSVLFYLRLPVLCRIMSESAFDLERR